MTVLPQPVQVLLQGIYLKSKNCADITKKITADIKALEKYSLQRYSYIIMQHNIDTIWLRDMMYTSLHIILCI